MDTNELRKWAENHSIESNTIKGFWVMFNNYKEEKKGEFLEVFGKDWDKSHF